MGLILALDPGLRTCGVALFKDGALDVAWLARNEEKTARGPAAWREMARAVREGIPSNRSRHEMELVAEVPQIYIRSPGDPNDLIQVAGVVGAVAAYVDPGTISFYLPREWKGQVPKEVMCARAEARLSESEKTMVLECPRALRHNVLDAIGIGLHRLARL